MARQKAKTKEELAESVARLGLTKKQALLALEAVFDTIKATLKRGGKVSLVGFGTFLVKDKRARRGRNPRSGEELNIPAKRQPFFRAGDILKEEVRDARQAEQSETGQESE